MMAPGLPSIAEHYHITNPTVLALTLSIFLLAFALGPLIIGPLSEIYGRAWVLHIANLFFLAFTLACAFAPNTGSLIAFRFLGEPHESLILLFGTNCWLHVTQPAWVEVLPFPSAVPA